MTRRFFVTMLAAVTAFGRVVSGNKKPDAALALPRRNVRWVFFDGNTCIRVQQESALEPWNVSSGDRIEGFPLIWANGDHVDTDFRRSGLRRWPNGDLDVFYQYESGPKWWAVERRYKHAKSLLEP